MSTSSPTADDAADAYYGNSRTRAVKPANAVSPPPPKKGWTDKLAQAFAIVFCTLLGAAVLSMLVLVIIRIWEAI